MASAIDDGVLAALNSSAAMDVTFMRYGHQHALERGRANTDQDGRAIGAAIAVELVSADTAGQAMNLKTAYDTPRSSQDVITKP